MSDQDKCAGGTATNFGVSQNSDELYNKLETIRVLNEVVKAHNIGSGHETTDAASKKIHEIIKTL